MPKTEEGLGFNVMGGKEQNSPIYISRIIPGSQLQKLSLVFPDHDVAIIVEFYEVQVELLTDTVVSSVETSCSVSTGCVAQFTKDRQSTNTQ